MITSVIPDSPKLKKKLQRIKALIDGGWQDEAIGIMEEGVKKVSELTPRSDGPGPHLADAWTLHVIGGKRKSMVAGPLMVIYNSQLMKRTGEFLKKAYLKVKGKKTDYTLLHILEYGSKAHVIEPWKAEYLVFKVKNSLFKRIMGKGAEQWVKTKQVHHPGTRAYGMVRLTMAWLQKRFKKFVKVWEKKIEKEFEK
jgi:hypothetical protein